VNPLPTFLALYLSMVPSGLHLITYTHLVGIHDFGAFRDIGFGDLSEDSVFHRLRFCPIFSLWRGSDPSILGWSGSAPTASTFLGMGSRPDFLVLTSWLHSSAVFRPFFLGEIMLASISSSYKQITEENSQGKNL